MLALANKNEARTLSLTGKLQPVNEQVECVCDFVRENETVTILELGGNLLNDEHVDMLCRALKWNSSVRTLDLTWNCIGDGGANHLAGLLKESSVLRNLYLDWNALTDVGGRQLAVAVTDNDTIVALSLEGNKVHNAVFLDSIARVCQGNIADTAQMVSFTARMEFDALEDLARKDLELARKAELFAGDDIEFVMTNVQDGLHFEGAFMQGNGNVDATPSLDKDQERAEDDPIDDDAAKSSRQSEEGLSESEMANKEDSIQSLGSQRQNSSRTVEDNENVQRVGESEENQNDANQNQNKEETMEGETNDEQNASDAHIKPSEQSMEAETADSIPAHPDREESKGIEKEKEKVMEGVMNDNGESDNTTAVEKEEEEEEPRDANVPKVPAEPKPETVVLSAKEQKALEKKKAAEEKARLKAEKEAAAKAAKEAKKQKKK